MAANVGNIDIVTDTANLEIPSCCHGPALLFTRYDQKSQQERQFFACSAFRDKRDCPFFQWVDTKVCKSADRPRDEMEPAYNHKAMRKRFLQIKKLKQNVRAMCQSCGILLLPGETEAHESKGHSIRRGISMAMLRRPTQLFSPLDNNKTYAQYLFSSQTTDFVLSTLSQLNTTHVLCVGCPRIHETVQLQAKREAGNQLCSLLLDLDHRYLQMYSPFKYLRYNMLNHHFFGGQADEQTFHDFLEKADGKSVAVVIDPPFGIMVDALYKTICKIEDVWRSSSAEDIAFALPVLWFFPYFMERRVLDSCPGYAMLDYKVDYDNHALFKGNQGRKKGSPVRIFTNLQPSRVPHPQDEGYRYCDACERYSSAENKHCDKCGTCPTKDGPTYRHCDACERCVKPSRVHCDTCRVCDVVGHRCGQTVGAGCHICGELGHKRRDCPTKGNADNKLSGKKRKAVQQTPDKMKKKKK